MLNDQAHLNPKLFDDDIEQVPSRNGYGEGLVLAADANDQVVALCADLTESTRTEEFAKKYRYDFRVHQRGRVRSTQTALRPNFRLKL